MPHRFKTLPYDTEEDKNSVSVPIKEMLTKLIQEDSGDSVLKIEDETPSKKSKLSGTRVYGVFTIKD